MSTDLQETGSTGSGVALEDPPTELGVPYHLVAQDTGQLQEAHAGMLAWVRNAQLAVERELGAEQANLAAAVDAGFKTSAFDARIKRLEKRKIFYGKIEAALLDGFVLVPNFPMNVFAVRTNAKPRGRPRDGMGAQLQQPQMLPIGEGENRNPNPLLEYRTETRHRNYGEKEAYEQVVSWPTDWQEEIDFPLTIARPELMQRTATTLARKLFDEIGVAVDANWSTRGVDPILLGRIRNPREGRPAVTFFLGWYFDPSRL